MKPSPRFVNAMLRFGTYLVNKCGDEGKAIELINSMQGKENTDCELLVTLVTLRFNISEQELRHGTLDFVIDLRGICYHLLMYRCHIGEKMVADFFEKDKTCNVRSLALKADGFLKRPMYKPQFVKHYKEVEMLFKEYSDTLITTE